MNSEVVVRKGLPDDVTAVHGMVVELAEFEREPNAVRTTPASLAEDLAAGAFFFFVALKGDDMVGFALCHWRFSTWTGKCLFLEDLYVKPAARGCGAGKALFAECIQIAAEADVARLQWQVLSWNEPAIAFYKKMGAEVTGEWLNCKLVREQLQKMKK